MTWRPADIDASPYDIAHIRRRLKAGHTIGPGIRDDRWTEPGTGLAATIAGRLVGRPGPVTIAILSDMPYVVDTLDLMLLRRAGVNAGTVIVMAAGLGRQGLTRVTSVTAETPQQFTWIAPVRRPANGGRIMEIFPRLGDDLIKIRNIFNLRMTLPDTMGQGLTALKGRPLSSLLVHPELAACGCDPIIRAVTAGPRNVWVRTDLEPDYRPVAGMTADDLSAMRT